MKELICIVCPKGCHLTIDIENETVKGNACKRGPIYGLNELKNPTRVVTSTVKIKDVENNVLPVKTKEGIPKALIFEVMKEINKVEVVAPIKVGDIIIRNILGTDVDIVACKSFG